jgi:hypothetical protein
VGHWPIGESCVQRNREDVMDWIGSNQMTRPFEGHKALVDDD